MDLSTGLAEGPWPRGDGWGGLYRAVERLAPRGGRLRGLLCRYYLPKPVERADRGRLYRGLGVGWFGRVIPTGGIAVRRLTGWKMPAYTLRGTSRGAARDFYYRTCVFETLHLPFFVALLVLTARQMVLGRLDLALEDALANLLLNVYPILHHRHTRIRIVRLLEAARTAATSGAGRRTHS